jgi:hypothetical protein
MLKANSTSTRIDVNVLLSTAFIVIFLMPALVVGQGSTPARGFQPAGSYALSDIETINTTNGNLMLNLALGKLAPGRGGLSGQLNLHYDSKLYDSRTQYYEDWEHPIFGQPQVVVRNMLISSDQGGWHYGTGLNCNHSFPPMKLSITGKSKWLSPTGVCMNFCRAGSARPFRRATSIFVPMAGRPDG